MIARLQTFFAVRCESMCLGLLRYLDSVLFGSVITLYWANRRLQKKVAECDVDQFDADERLGHSTEDLDGELSLSIERLERIENKAMGTLLGVAVAIVVFGSTSRFLGENGVLGAHSETVAIVGGAGLIVSMLYLIVSGLLALGAYRIGEVHRPTLSDRYPLADVTTEAKTVVYSIEQNQRYATLRSNRLSASFACLRNGLVVVLMLGILMVVLAIPDRTGSECPTSASTGTAFSACASKAAG